MIDDPVSRRGFLAGAADLGGATLLLGAERAAAADGPKTLTILHTNDLHSNFIGLGPASDYAPFQLNDDGARGGFARLATLIAERRAARQSDGPVLVVDGGDFSMGTAFGAATRETGAELRLMARMGYDATTLGNHDFDLGPDGLAESVEVAVQAGRIPAVVASNTQFAAVCSPRRLHGGTRAPGGGAAGRNAARRRANAPHRLTDWRPIGRPATAPRQRQIATDRPRRAGGPTQLPKPAAPHFSGGGRLTFSASVSDRRHATARRGVGERALVALRQRVDERRDKAARRLERTRRRPALQPTPSRPAARDVCAAREPPLVLRLRLFPKRGAADGLLDRAVVNRASMDARLGTRNRLLPGPPANGPTRGASSHSRESPPADDDGATSPMRTSGTFT